MGDPGAARLAAGHCTEPTAWSDVRVALLGCLFFLDAGNPAAAKRLLEQRGPLASGEKFPEDVLALKLQIAIGLQDRAAAQRYSAQLTKRGKAIGVDITWRLVYFLATSRDKETRSEGRVMMQDLIRILPMPLEHHPAYSTCKAIEAVVFAECGEWDKAAASAQDALAHQQPRYDTNDYKALLKLIQEHKPYRSDPALGHRQPLFPCCFMFLQPLATKKPALPLRFTNRPGDMPFEFPFRTDESP